MATAATRRRRRAQRAARARPATVSYRQTSYRAVRAPRTVKRVRRTTALSKATKSRPSRRVSQVRRKLDIARQVASQARNIVHDLVPVRYDPGAPVKVCKKRPDARKAGRARGRGGARTTPKFIPWCDRRK